MFIHLRRRVGRLGRLCCAHHARHPHNSLLTSPAPLRPAMSRRPPSSKTTTQGAHPIWALEPSLSTLTVSMIVARDALCVARRAHNCRLPDPQPCPSGPRLAARRDIDAVIADLIAIHHAGDPQQRCSLASSPLPTLILALFGN